MSQVIQCHAMAVVNRLPRTADGVPIVPGMNLYVYDGVDGKVFRDDVGAFMIEIHSEDNHVIHLRDSNGEEWTESPDDCYFARAAAEAREKP